MARGKRHRAPVEVLLDRLDAKHSSGLAADGRRFGVRPGAPGARVLMRPGRKQKGSLLEVLEPPPDGVTPRCPVFGVCGGCQLQELPLSSQIHHKLDLLKRLVEIGEQPGDAYIHVHGVRPTCADGYHYRNKLELSFGARRFDRDGKPEDGGQGSFLGFHPPGWYSKIVPLRGCPLGSLAMQPVIACVVDMALSPAWNSHTHTGTWRHLVIRDAGTVDAPAMLVTLVTSSDATAEAVQVVADAVAAVPGVKSVLHVVTDGVAEVARGELKAVLHGEARLHFTLGSARLDLPHDAFFQVNSAGAEVLLQTIAEAAQLEAGHGGTLVDLYCGVGAIGLALAPRVDRVIGVELHADSIDRARENAVLNSVVGEWHAGTVEDLLPTLDLGERPILIVDPPRAGLHPKAAEFLAQQDAEVLVYVSCGPASLARDRAVLRAGGWQLTDLWGVDLFAQTHHMEAVARFVRIPATTESAPFLTAVDAAGGAAG